ncbi:unnamed protein product [Closterium sp. NIES-65]|nr:unnamed protein product [Closterium sp. NIES-65]
MNVRSAIDLDLNQRPEILVAIEESLSRCLVQSDLEGVPGVGPKQEGKVRDVYTAKPAAGSAASSDSNSNTDEELLVVVTTDRQSAFDRILASVPFKGQVLNQTSAWWFEQTAPIVPNAFLSSPDPNVTIFRKCKVFPVEFVVRGYITGTTSTSLWTVYSDGARSYCGNDLPEGLCKNDRLSANILTPTTKAADHDEPVTPEEIVLRGLMTREEFETTRDLALKLFAFGQQVAGEHGLILVDTKYEFGKDSDGNIRLIDELFAFGQQVAGQHGLILVDTKYEFGKDLEGNIRIIDELEMTRDLAVKLLAFRQQVAGEQGLILVDTKYEFGKDSDGNMSL